MAVVLLILLLPVLVPIAIVAAAIAYDAHVMRQIAAADQLWTEHLWELEVRRRELGGR